MNKKILLYMLFTLILCSMAFGLAKPYMPNEPILNDYNENKHSNLITGDVVFDEKSNDIQKIYLKSIPAVVKIIVYVDFDRFLPNIESVDPYYYNNKIERGLEPTYDDLNVDYDKSINYYDLLEEEFGDDYGSDVREFPYSIGSGFIINPDGYILTNAHVLSIDPEETKEIIKWTYINWMSYGMDEAYANDPEYDSDRYMEDWILLNFMIEKLEIRNLKVKTKVIVGVDKPGENLIFKEYTPKIIDHEGGIIDLETGEYDDTKLDWALLKIDGSNFPSLELGDSDKPSVGSQVILIGYPFVSEEVSDVDDYTYKINIEPTLTTGYISQITSNKNNKHFQVDLSASEGNSGGPALDNNGKVIGILTSGLLIYAGGNYNYVQMINDINSRIKDKVQPKQGELDNAWERGLENYWNKSYIEAKSDLDRVLTLNPSHPYVKRVLPDVEKKAKIAELENEKAKAAEIEKEQQIEAPTSQFNDSSPKSSYGFSYANIAILIIGIIIIIMLVISIFKKKGKRR